MGRSHRRHAARRTLPFLMQEVQTSRRIDVPLITVRTVWMFGRNMRDERRLTRRFRALLPVRATRRPKLGSLPHTSHREDTLTPRITEGWQTPDDRTTTPDPPPNGAARIDQHEAAWCHSRHPHAMVMPCQPGPATRRDGGRGETLPSRHLDMKACGGADPLAGERHDLTETLPARTHARTTAGSFATRREDDMHGRPTTAEDHGSAAEQFCGWLSRTAGMVRRVPWHGQRRDRRLLHWKVGAGTLGRHIHLLA